MSIRGHFLRNAVVLAAFGLAACTTTPAPVTRPDPQTASPHNRPEGLPAPGPTASSANSELGQYYRRLQNDLLDRGLMRTDSGGRDAPFTDTQLAANFERIALYDEYAPGASQLTNRLTPSSLRRWERPIRMSVRFGATIAPSDQAPARAEVAGFADRLSRLTGVPITQTDQNPNYYVLFMNEPDRRAAGPLLRQLVPGIADSSVNAFLTLPRDILCIVVTFSEDGGPAYTKAIALIRGEHPDAMRLSCIHEELAQGMGLANDSPNARPSIFNDDEEFGLLTRHDEILLKMLYDRRFRAGMTAAEAAPIARRIATEIMSGAV